MRHVANQNDNYKKDALKVIETQLGMVRGPGRSEVEERGEGGGKAAQGEHASAKPTDRHS